jgi:hypothetical protein
MGRITPSFRQVFLDLMRQLRFKKRSFFYQLRDEEQRNAFDAIFREAWAIEMAAMMQANIYPITDVINLMAAVHVRADLVEIEERIERLRQRIEDYQI